MPRTLWVVPFSALVLLAACSRAPASSPPVPEPQFATLMVRPEAVQREQTWDGVVEAVKKVTFSAQTNARVTALPFDVGDQVAEGDVLVRFSDIEEMAARRAAKAQVAAARAEYEDAQTSWKRARALVKRGVVTQAQLDAAIARRDAARADLHAAEAALRAAEQQVDYTVIRATFDGVVMRRFVHVGEAVQSGPPVPQPLIRLASLKALRVEVSVPQGTAEAIRKHRAATVVTADGTRIPAARITVFPHADPATHTFRVRVGLPDDTDGLYPGMTVKVRFAVGETRRLLVPLDAIVRRGALRAVYVVGPGHAVSLRQLRLGHRVGNGVEVLAGLEAGARIATDPGAAARYLAERYGSGEARP